jgi:methylthioribose-1-phosphate isomerase
VAGPIEPLRILRGEGIDVLDQTLLPLQEVRRFLGDMEGVSEAIRSLRVRGAPLLGLTGACGLAIGASTRGSGDAALRTTAAELTATRPTAVDLGAAVNAGLAAALAVPASSRTALLWDRAEAMQRQRIAEDARIAESGAALLTGGVLTHCNTGALATGASGTAFAVIAEAHRRGTLTMCFATETRPLLQGARLTAWELKHNGIPATLLPDTAAASLLASGQVRAVITGADRIAANGDSANKIGTYQLALAAARHGIPFYIAAPMTTIDLACPSGAHIPIEFRDASEVGGFGGQRWSPEGIAAYNPAFDVTPAGLIAGIVTEHGVARAPYAESLRAMTVA